MIQKKEVESLYGKQNLLENSFTAKACLLQSIWRVNNDLKIGIKSQ